MLLEQNTTITRSSVYRTFCRNNINKVPQEKRDKAKKFKEYEPGYLHMDLTYLPKLDGIKYYLFVAIDRATRNLYFEVYDAKTSENTDKFMNNCLEYFPFNITHVLTDNGLEFTNSGTSQFTILFVFSNFMDTRLAFLFSFTTISAKVN